MLDGMKKSAPQGRLPPFRDRSMTVGAQVNRAKERNVLKLAIFRHRFGLSFKNLDPSIAFVHYTEPSPWVKADLPGKGKLLLTLAKFEKSILKSTVQPENSNSVTVTVQNKETGARWSNRQRDRKVN